MTSKTMNEEIESVKADHKHHATAIAALQEQSKSHAERLARHSAHLAKLDESVAMLREALGSVATKTDIMDLREDISSQFNRNLRDAHNSVPAKLTVLFGAGMFLIAMLGLAINLVHHG